jgi:hypothetical protein
MSPEERFQKVSSAMRRHANVSLGATKGFGSSALTVGGKIFAMLAPKHGFVVKLPKARIDELVESGDGSRFEPGPGRVMKEWFVADAKSGLDWTALAREAMEFVVGTRK